LTWLEALVQVAHASVEEEVLEGLWGRGVSTEQVNTFRIGYLARLPALEFPPEFLEWYLDREDVLVFPLTTFYGQVKGIQVRYQDREKKGYSDFFTTRTEPCLFGLREAAPHMLSTREVVLTEGVYDFCPVQRVIPQTISTLTAKVNKQLMRSLYRCVDRVVSFYDRDDSGVKGTKEVERNAPPELKVYTMEYPLDFKGKDPGELWEAYGDDWYKRYLTEQQEGRL